MPRLPLTLHRFAVAGSAAASFFLASCSESPNAPTREIAPGTSSLNQSPELADATGRHIFHTKEWHENDNAQNNNGNAHGKPGGGGTSTGISYHGGSLLIDSTNVVSIYLGPSAVYSNGPAPGAVGTAGTTGSGTQDGSLIGTFLTALGGSGYFNINTTYYDGTGAHVKNTVHYNGYWANPNLPSTSSISDADMVAMLQTGFNSGQLKYNSSTVYAIFTGKGVNLGGGFASNGLQYCAYHTHGTVTVNGAVKTVLYAAMPYDYTFPGSCTNATTPPNGDWAADAEVSTLAHEIEESTTDMLGTAWWDNRGYENADKCAWNFGATVPSPAGVANMKIGANYYLVQQNWVNAGSGGCAKSY